MININKIEGLESQFGLYTYGNEAFVDVAYHSGEDINHTEVHENIHLILSLGSSYGLLINMLKKVSLIDQSKEWVRKELINKMMSMQECIATAIEYLNILKCEGKEAYNLAYSQFKRDNGYKKYHKAIKNARWIMEDATSDNVDIYINLLKIIGIKSLQIKVDEIPVAAFECKQNMDKFMTIQENCLKYHPNKRCNELLKGFKVLLSSSSDKRDMDYYINQVNLIFESIIDAETVSMVCKKVILNIYKDSLVLKNIERRVSGFGKVRVAMDHAESLAIYPADLNDKFNAVYDHSTILLYELIDLINKKSDGFLFINNRLSGLEQIHLTGYINYRDKKIQTTNQINEKTISELIKISEIPTLFMEKKRFIDYKENLDRTNFNKPIYICMESAILYNVDFIREYFSSGIYTFFSIEKRNLMLVKKNDYIVIQPISKNAIESIKKIIKEDKIEIYYREWIVSGLINLEHEINNIDYYHREFMTDAMRGLGDL